MAAQCHGIEKCLRRVLVGAVTSVQYRQIHPAGVRETVSSARGRMTHNDGVRAHGLERQGGVLE